MVDLSTLFPKHGSRKPKRRVGLGLGSGMGRSSTKGMKGQSSRSGNTKKESKEGGQMPLVRRIPKSGFSNAMFENRYELVNIGSFDKVFKVGGGSFRNRGSGRFYGFTALSQNGFFISSMIPISSWAPLFAKKLFLMILSEGEPS